MQKLDNNKPFISINIAIMTVSDSRTRDNDKSGDYLESSLLSVGHKCIDRVIVRDDVENILEILKKWIIDKKIDVIITTGGTGITGRDVTPEAIESIKDKYIPGFGEAFRFLSYEKIGSSTIQSRAIACIANATFIFTLPGSPGACRDAWENILIYQLDNRNRPCNLVELMPRLKEK